MRPGGTTGDSFPPDPPSLAFGVDVGDFRTPCGSAEPRWKAVGGAGIVIPAEAMQGALPPASPPGTTTAVVGDERGREAVGRVSGIDGV